MGKFQVTGGCSFIGLHLMDALVSDCHADRVLDNFSSGHRKNIPHGVELIVGDAIDRATVGRAAQGANDISHLAAIISTQISVTDWLASHCPKMTGTITVFDTACRTGFFVSRGRHG